MNAPQALSKGSLGAPSGLRGPSKLKDASHPSALKEPEGALAKGQHAPLALTTTQVAIRTLYISNDSGSSEKLSSSQLLESSTSVGALSKERAEELWNLAARNLEKTDAEITETCFLVNEAMKLYKQRTRQLNQEVVNFTLLQLQKISDGHETDVVNTAQAAAFIHQMAKESLQECQLQIQQLVELHEMNLNSLLRHQEKGIFDKYAAWLKEIDVTAQLLTIAQSHEKHLAELQDKALDGKIEQQNHVLAKTLELARFKAAQELKAEQLAEKNKQREKVLEEKIERLSADTLKARMEMQAADESLRLQKQVAQQQHDQATGAAMKHKELSQQRLQMKSEAANKALDEKHQERMKQLSHP